MIKTRYHYSKLTCGKSKYGCLIPLVDSAPPLRFFQPNFSKMEVHFMSFALVSSLNDEPLDLLLIQPSYLFVWFHEGVFGLDTGRSHQYEKK